MSSEPNTPERLAEAIERSFFALIVYYVVFIGVVVWAGATTDGLLRSECSFPCSGCGVVLSER